MRVEQPILAATIIEPEIAPSPFLDDIQNFDQEDETLEVRSDYVVFVGSTSIARWKTLQEDFKGINVLNRGLEGSALIDVIRYADRIILKYQPKVVVVYGGENDIAMFGSQCSDVFRHLTTLVDLIHRQLPETKILYLSLKPSPERSDCLEMIVRANRLIREYTQTNDHLFFVDTIQGMLDERGNVRHALFADDGVRLSQEGYDVWAPIIRPHIETALKD